MNTLVQCRASARNFLDYNGFNFIVDACNLTPGKSWLNWFDEDFNGIRIKKDKKVIIVRSNKNCSVTSDVYKKALFKDIKDYSRWEVVFKNGHTSAHFLYGKDNRLRLCLLNNGVWIKNIPPLLAGFECLKTVEKAVRMKREERVQGAEIALFKTNYCDVKKVK